MRKVRAGNFSASLSEDSQMYIWGTGIFGEFFTPHRVKGVHQLDVLDFQIGKDGFTVLLSNTGKVYSWGYNNMG